MKDRFLSNATDVMEWPSASPEYNLIENFLGLPSRLVHSDFRLLDDQKSLLEAIETG